MAVFPYAALWRDAEQYTLGFPLLQKASYPWEILPLLSDFIRAVGRQLPRDEYEQLSDGVWAARTAHIAPSAHVGAPCIIGHDTEVRHCAFIRGAALVGDGAVIGNSTELKSCVLFDGVQVPHFNYVGDSILGYRAHLGAGAITSNVKGDRADVVVRVEQARIPSGRHKLGAMIGDLVEIGCNSVLNPGGVIGRESRIYPSVSVRGFVGERCVIKGDGSVARRR